MDFVGWRVELWAPTLEQAEALGKAIGKATGAGCYVYEGGPQEWPSDLRSTEAEGVWLRVAPPWGVENENAMRHAAVLHDTLGCVADASRRWQARRG